MEQTVIQEIVYCGGKRDEFEARISSRRHEGGTY